MTQPPGESNLASTVPSEKKPCAPSIARRPALWAVVWLIVGISAFESLPVWPWVWMIFIATLLAASWILRSRTAWRTAALSIALALTGLLRAQQSLYYFDRADISSFTADDTRLTWVRLRVDHPPRTVVDESQSPRPTPPRQSFRASVRQIRTQGGWIDADGLIAVTITPPHPLLVVGQTIETMGRLSRPHPAVNEGEFDLASHYRRQRILATLHVLDPAAVTIIDSPAPSLLQRCRRTVRTALAKGFSPDDSLDHALLQTLLLGDDDSSIRDIEETFRRTGTSHHLAISGMHIAVLSGFILLLGRSAGLGPKMLAGVVGAFVAIYGLMAIPSVPVVRAVVLSIATAVGLLGRRSVDFLQLLALGGIAILIYQPLDLFSAGFQLSFGVVFGLVMLTRPSAQAIDWRNPLDTPPFAASSKRQALARWLQPRLLQLFAAGLAAWLVALPLVAIHFQRLNPWAMPASMILAPLVFLGLIGGFVKVVLTLLLPGWAGAWAMMALWPISGMRLIAELLARMPLSDLPLPSPSIGFAAAYYAALFMPLTIPMISNRMGRRWRLLPIGLMLLLTLIPVFRSWAG